jgi:hypothetical protein
MLSKCSRIVMEREDVVSMICDRTRDGKMLRRIHIATATCREILGG